MQGFGLNVASLVYFLKNISSERFEKTKEEYFV